MREQCVSVKDYCDVIHDYHTPLSKGYDSKVVARGKVNERINSKNLSGEKRKCYEKLAQSLSPNSTNIFFPLYGVPYCDRFGEIEKYQDIVLPLNNEEEHLNDDEYAYLNDYIKSKQEVYQSYLKENNLTACSPITEGVVIDDQYINAALENEQRNRDVFRSDLEVINKQAAECECYD